MRARRVQAKYLAGNQQHSSSWHSVALRRGCGSPRPPCLQRSECHVMCGDSGNCWRHAWPATAQPSSPINSAGSLHSDARLQGVEKYSGRCRDRAIIARKYLESCTGPQLRLCLKFDFARSRQQAACRPQFRSSQAPLQTLCIYNRSVYAPVTSQRAPPIAAGAPAWHASRLTAASQSKIAPFPRITSTS